MALYRKYRPATFGEVVGQEHVTVPLATALRSGRINHAYLFSGPRGCGKTSSARILARSLNCEQGPTPEPCGVCASCVALAPGGTGNMDVTELDAASHGGVEDARDLRDRAFYAPAESRYRVFIIDEAHMVTNAGFNALLKIVEEPPEHLIFIFATTEPEKVLPTIRSRTHHYPFRLLPPTAMRGLLEKICAQEQVAVEPAVFPLVVRAGGGSPRDSLSILDQLIAGADEGGVAYRAAVGLLGVTDSALINNAVDALAQGDRPAVFATVSVVIDAGHDPRRFTADLLDRFRDLLILQAVPGAAETGLVDAPEEQLQRMEEQAQALPPATLTRYAEITHRGLGEMRGATNPRLLLEVLVARMTLPEGSDDPLAMAQRIEALEQGVVRTAPSHRVPAREVSAAGLDAGTGGQAEAPTAPREVQGQGVQGQGAQVQGAQAQVASAGGGVPVGSEEPGPNGGRTFVRPSLQPESSAAPVPSAAVPAADTPEPQPPRRPEVKPSPEPEVEQRDARTPVSPAATEAPRPAQVSAAGPAPVVPAPQHDAATAWAQSERAHQRQPEPSPVQGSGRGEAVAGDPGAPTPVPNTAVSSAGAPDAGVSDTAPALDSITLRNLWSEIRTQVGQRSKITQVLLSEAQVRAVRPAAGDGFEVILTHTAKSLVDRLNEERHRVVMEETIHAVTGAVVQVRSISADAAEAQGLDGGAPGGAASAPPPRSESPAAQATFTRRSAAGAGGQPGPTRPERGTDPGAQPGPAGPPPRRVAPAADQPQPSHGGWDGPPPEPGYDDEYPEDPEGSPGASYGYAPGAGPADGPGAAEAGGAAPSSESSSRAELSEEDMIAEKESDTSGGLRDHRTPEDLAVELLEKHLGATRITE